MKQDRHIERISRDRGDERFRRAQRLRSSQDFWRTRQRGRRVSGINLVLHYARRSCSSGGLSRQPTVDRTGSPMLQQSDEVRPTRIGLSVSKKVGSAVTRNLVKRRLREAVRHRLALLASGWDLVLTARPSAAAAQYPELVTELDDLFTRAGMWMV